MDQVVQMVIGGLHLQIAALQIQVEALQEQLAEAKRTAETMKLHRVPDRVTEAG